MDIRANVFKNRYPNFGKIIIIRDNSWSFTHNPETKRQTVHWNSSDSPRQKKARMTESKFAATMILFFAHVDWVPEGQIVNQLTTTFVSGWEEQVSSYVRMNFSPKRSAHNELSMKMLLIMPVIIEQRIANIPIGIVW